MSQETTKEIINDLYACVDEDKNQRENCGNYKISVFFTPKVTLNKDAMFKDVLKLEYNKQVKKIVLEDNLYSIGMSGYIDVDNTGSWIDKILSRSNQFYVVINFTEYMTVENTTETIPNIKYEPFIFDISYVESLSSPVDTDKILRIGLMDIVTSILEQHSIASVIQFDRNITKTTSYKNVFKYILEYVKDHIQTNLNQKYVWKKDLLYDSNCMFLGKVSSGCDAETADMSWLIEDTFARIPRNATISQALKTIYQDACTTMIAPARFEESYEKIGNVLIPFFFKEEFPDTYFIYPTVWTNSKPKSNEETTAQNAAHQDASSIQETTQNNYQAKKQRASWQEGLKNLVESRNSQGNKSILYNKEYGGDATMLLYRQMTMRDIFMPFLLAFGSDKYEGIFEDINPQENSKSVFTFNGVVKEELQDIQYDPIRIKDLNKLWKNVIFIACAGDSTSGDSTLIFFEWFYDYFTSVFLNESIEPGQSKNKIATACPAFHKMMLSEQIAHGSATNANDKGFINKVDEHNSYIYATRTKDTINECMRLMGKNIASFVLANDTYTFTIKGNIRRRPNEIIKVGYKAAPSDTAIRPITLSTGIFDANHTFLYVSAITHTFIGQNYTNTIRTHRFVESLPDV